MTLTCNIIAAMVITSGGVITLWSANVLTGSVMSGDLR